MPFQNKGNNDDAEFWIPRRGRGEGRGEHQTSTQNVPNTVREEFLKDSPCTSLMRYKSQVNKRHLAEYLGRVVYSNPHLLSDFATYWGQQSKNSASGRNKNMSSAMAVESEGVIVNRSLFVDRSDSYSFPKHYIRMRRQSYGCFSGSFTGDYNPSFGQFGTVFHAVDKASLNRNPPAWFAEKLIKIKEFRENELKILCEMDHKHIVKVFGAIRTNFGVHIFMQLAPGGNIHKLIKEKVGFGDGPGNSHLFTEFWAVVYFAQILEALLYLKSRHVVHCDVKPRNVVLSSDKKICFLTDFGEARFIPSGFEYVRTFGTIGTQQYMSPELITEEKYYYGSDVWSAGCCLLNMLTGYSPWSIAYPNLSVYFYVIGQNPCKILEEIPIWTQSITSSILRNCFDDIKTRKPVHELSVLAERAIKLLREKYMQKTCCNSDTKSCSIPISESHNLVEEDNEILSCEESLVPVSAELESSSQAEIENKCPTDSALLEISTPDSNALVEINPHPVSCDDTPSDDQEESDEDEDDELDRLLQQHKALLAEDDNSLYESDPSKKSINDICQLSELLKSEKFEWVFKETTDKS